MLSVTTIYRNKIFRDEFLTRIWFFSNLAIYQLATPAISVHLCPCTALTSHRLVFATPFPTHPPDHKMTSWIVNFIITRLWQRTVLRSVENLRGIVLIHPHDFMDFTRELAISQYGQPPEDATISTSSFSASPTEAKKKSDIGKESRSQWIVFVLLFHEDLSIYIVIG